MKFTESPEAYRIGIAWDWATIRLYAAQGEWRRVRYVLLHRIPANMRRRSWWGLWQYEWPGCQRAVRGVTKAHAERRGRRRMHAMTLIGSSPE